MFREQLWMLAPALSILVLLVVFMLYVHFSTARHYRIKLLLAPALLVASMSAAPYVGNKLGYGWPSALPLSFEYMAHRVLIVASEKRWIDVLVISRKPFRTDPRLHRLPWSQKLEDALDRAQTMKEGKEGGDIVMNADATAPRDGDDYPDYVPKRVLPQEQMPKPGYPGRLGPDREQDDERMRRDQPSSRTMV
jgi:hypothetical protein